ncbi:MAG: hypothetical protein B6D46_05855 [Polyangiaceae bacterium UTPRO1]|jgi:hypothetical protein|nr:hypothetical protein [Myxococcales bacterium]OQY67547.1 MAG: hypothetical protein B6D46_05855 [Polyangiaceae bacterium UTPRO1]
MAAGAAASAAVSKSHASLRAGNAEWQSSSDPASRTAKMKDGQTHLAYKAEHVIDLDTEVILAPQVYPGDAGDTATLTTSVEKAETYGAGMELSLAIAEVVANKGYHAAATLTACSAVGLRTYIAAPKSGGRRWDDKPPAWELAYRANRRRGCGARSRRLHRRRLERSERSFAHTCGSGNERCIWLLGLENVRKRYLLTAAARNLGLAMRKIFGIGTPRSLQGLAGRVSAFVYALVALFAGVTPVLMALRCPTQPTEARGTGDIATRCSKIPAFFNGRLSAYVGSGSN